MEEPHSTRRRSPYWCHFVIGDSDVPNRKRATCKYCPQVLSCTEKGCTGNLARHIRQKHPDIMNVIAEEQENIMANTKTEYEYLEEDNNPSPHSSVFLLSVSEGDNSQDSDNIDAKLDLKRGNSQSYQSTPVKRKPPVEQRQNRSNTPDSAKGETVADRFDIFGSLVAMKMRELRRDQMILAEKLINDTLHEATMDNLNSYCGLNLVQVNMVDESNRDALSVNSVSSNNVV